MIHAVGILIGNKTKKKKRLFFGGLQGSRITKMGLLVFISDKNKKRGKKVRAVSIGLSARGPTRRRKFTGLAELRGGWPIELGTTNMLE